MSTVVPQNAPPRMRLAIQADMLSTPVGGGRFLRGLLAALFAEQELLDQFEHIYIVATQNESTECLGSLPANVSVVRRRFPSRLRRTPLARLFGYTLPAVDVAYGSFFHVFPSRARAHVVTVHDLSCFDERYHPLDKIRKTAAQTAHMIQYCNGVVCSSNATLGEFRQRWPLLAHKAVTVYCGVSADETRSRTPYPVRERSILAVGTIEPRKNYPTLLDAYERLVREQGEKAPQLIVVGALGWMSDEVAQRLAAFELAGKCRWLRTATDEQLADEYARAGVFSYLSLCEGFGYPPFEAAFARCPMVLSNASSVGEIWSQHARCVDPLDVEGIIAGWKWALALSPVEREAVADRQEIHAQEFSWNRTIHEYVAFWKKLAHKKTLCKKSIKQQ